jgi:hypothetical protein
VACCENPDGGGFNAGLNQFSRVVFPFIAQNIVFVDYNERWR